MKNRKATIIVYDTSPWPDTYTYKLEINQRMKAL